LKLLKENMGKILLQDINSGSAFLNRLQ
jgi:hypothetical protein